MSRVQTAEVIKLVFRTEATLCMPYIISRFGVPKFMLAFVIMFPQTPEMFAVFGFFVTFSSTALAGCCEKTATFCSRIYIRTFLLS